MKKCIHKPNYVEFTYIPLLIIFTLFFLQNSTSRVLYVPQDYTTIQNAITVTGVGDTVLISPGIYYEQILILDKQLTLAGTFLLQNDSSLRDSTIIILPDSIRNGPGFQKTTIRVTRSNVTIFGLTIRNGRGRAVLLSPGSYRLMGGGVCVDSSTVQIHWSKVSNCQAEYGGGIGSIWSSFELSNSIIDSCSASSVGGGLYTNRSDTSIVTNTLFLRNSSNFLGGGYSSSDYYGELVNCDFIENYANTGSGGGAGLTAVGNNGGIHLVKGNRFIQNSAGSDAGVRIQTNAGSDYAILENQFINNIVTSGPSNAAGLYVASMDSVNWRICDNIFVGNNGGAICLQTGNYDIRRNQFILNQRSLGSVMSSRNRVFMNFDSNFVANNLGERVFYIITSTTINASDNDFVGNQGIITTAANSMFNNFWGHPSGPRTASNPGGQGDSLPDGIPYIPYRTTPVFPELDVKDFGDGSERGQYGSGLPNTVTIEKVYPNPTNSTLTVNYTINRTQLVSIRLYDTNGREVYASLPQPQIAGSHTFSLQTDGIASGLYFLKLSSPTSTTESALQKVVLLK